MPFCDHLLDSKCRLIDERCGWLQKKKPCRLFWVYPKIKPQEGDPPMTKEVKEKILPDVLDNWRKYIRKRGGGRGMIGKPLEDHVMNLLKSELTGANVERRKRFQIFENVNVVIDGKIEKEGKPTTLISCKVTLSPPSFRESFSCAYLAKQRQRNVKFYMIATHSSDKPSKNLADVGKPYIDGIYYLSEKPYFDELVKELKGIYGGS